MRSLIALVAAATTMALAGAANAADLGGDNYTSFKDEAPYVRQYNWTGVYIGAQLGYAWSDVDADSGPFGSFNQSYGYNVDGFIGGGHLGYNWQSQGIVFGLEADVEYTDLEDGGIGTAGFGHRTDVNWMGSMRARLGLPMDRALLYVTGGWAFADVDVTKSSPPGAAPFGSYGSIRNGWTLGVGAEYAFTENLTARLEYRYTDFGSDSGSSRPAAANWQDDSDLTMHALRAGMSLKF